MTDDEGQAAAIARMDQVLALVREAAEGLIDADRPPGTPVIDPFMYGVGLDLLTSSDGGAEELVELAAGAALLLADSMATVRRLEAERDAAYAWITAARQGAELAINAVAQPLIAAAGKLLGGQK